MTVRYSVDVFCDRCGDWIHGVCVLRPTGSARVALKEAQRNGWSRDVRSTYLDVCPACLRETRTEEIRR